MILSSNHTVTSLESSIGVWQVVYIVDVHKEGRVVQRHYRHVSSFRRSVRVGRTVGRRQRVVVVVAVQFASSRCCRRRVEIVQVIAHRVLLVQKRGRVDGRQAGRGLSNRALAAKLFVLEPILSVLESDVFLIFSRDLFDLLP